MIAQAAPHACATVLSALSALVTSTVSIAPMAGRVDEHHAPQAVPRAPAARHGAPCCQWTLSERHAENCLQHESAPLNYTAQRTRSLPTSLDGTRAAPFRHLQICAGKRFASTSPALAYSPRTLLVDVCSCCSTTIAVEVCGLHVGVRGTLQGLPAASLRVSVDTAGRCLRAAACAAARHGVSRRIGGKRAIKGFHAFSLGQACARNRRSGIGIGEAARALVPPPRRQGTTTRRRASCRYGAHP